MYNYRPWTTNSTWDRSSVRREEFPRQQCGPLLTAGDCDTAPRVLRVRGCRDASHNQMKISLLIGRITPFVYVAA